MKKVLDWVGMFVGGWLGWSLLAGLGIFAAFIGSVVGMGAGMYAMRQVGRRLLP